MPELRRYLMPNGRSPFGEWFGSLKDTLAKARIRMRLRQLESGNFGDCSSVGDGVIELRVHVGPGYRIYCGRKGSEIVLLLCGGCKQSQEEDIRRAKSMWVDWKEREP